MMRIPFGSLPSLSALFLDYVSDWNRVRSFYPQNYSLDSIIAFAKQKPALERTHRERLCAALAEQQKFWDADTRSIDKLCAGAVAVIAGQQPGLFGGPLYALPTYTALLELRDLLADRGVARRWSD